MVPEIWSETNRILCHFGPFFALLPPPRPPPTPPPLMIPKIKILKKNEKNTWILSFYTNMCTINEDHMIYSSRNIRCDIHNFLSFWAIFYPFSPLKTWKIKILKLNKTPGDIILLHIHTTNENTMMYGSSDMKHSRLNFFSFWIAVSPFTCL